MRHLSDPISKNFGAQYCAHTTTLDQSLVDILRLFDIKRIYGIGGDYAANLIKALNPHFDLIPSSNEMHAAFSACAEAEINGISAALVTYTVGSLPCLSAAALAKTENLPVIFISGCPAPDEAHLQSVHHMVHSSHSWSKDEDSALSASTGYSLRALTMALQ